MDLGDAISKIIRDILSGICKTYMYDKSQFGYYAMKHYQPW